MEISKAYRELFLGPVAQTVLEDLAYQCHADRTTWALDGNHPEPMATVHLEGRRWVYLYIQDRIREANRGVE